MGAKYGEHAVGLGEQVSEAMWKLYTKLSLDRLQILFGGASRKLRTWGVVADGLQIWTVLTDEFAPHSFASLSPPERSGENHIQPDQGDAFEPGGLAVVD